MISLQFLFVSLNIENLPLTLFKLIFGYSGSIGSITRLVKLSLLIVNQRKFLSSLILKGLFYIKQQIQFRKSSMNTYGRIITILLHNNFHKFKIGRVTASLRQILGVFKGLFTQKCVTKKFIINLSYLLKTSEVLLQRLQKNH